MNTTFQVKNARVVSVGEFSTGTNENGPWAALDVTLMWDYQPDDQQQPTSTQKCVVTLMNSQATWGRDNLRAGNPYAGVPDTFVDMHLRMQIKTKEVARKDGGTFRKTENRIYVEYITICQPQNNPYQP